MRRSMRASCCGEGLELGESPSLQAPEAYCVAAQTRSRRELSWEGCQKKSMGSAES